MDDFLKSEKQIQENKILTAYKDQFRIIPEPDGIAGISSTAVRTMFVQNSPVIKEMLHPGVYKLLINKGGLDMDITLFRGDYDFLSNFYEAGIEYKGIHYANNEAAFQAQKCLDEKEKKEFSNLSASKAR